MNGRTDAQALASLAIGMALAAGSVCAYGQDTTQITINVINRQTREPVDVQVMRDAGKGEVPLRGVSTRSPIRFPESECSVTTAYRVEPLSFTTFVPIEDWRACELDGVFQFELIPLATRPARLAIWTVEAQSAAMAASAANTAVQPGLGIIREALQAGDLGTASFISNEMRIALEAAGQPQAAETFRIITLATGADGVLTAAGEQSDTAVFLAGPSGQAELSPEIRAAVEAYQATAGLPADGRIGWQTMRSLSSLAQDDIQQLSAYRLEAIGPIGSQ